MSHRFTSLLTHLIFSTKNRFPYLDPELAPRTHAYLAGIINHMGGTALIINGAVDHVHLLFDNSPTVSISDCVRTLKSNSSKWIHETFHDPSKFAWQRGYAAFSVSKSECDRVFAYVESQQEHHRRWTYQDEVRRFLKQHGLECDERYMWE
jgi:putative transposase